MLPVRKLSPCILPLSHPSPSSLCSGATPASVNKCEYSWRGPSCTSEPGAVPVAAPVCHTSTSLTSYAMTAKLKTSALSLYGCLRYTSGAMYIRVPVRPSCSSCPATWAVHNVRTYVYQEPVPTSQVLITYRHLFSITLCATMHASLTPPHTPQGTSGPHLWTTPMVYTSGPHLWATPLSHTRPTP